MDAVCTIWSLHTDNSSHRRSIVSPHVEVTCIRSFDTFNLNVEHVKIKISCEDRTTHWWKINPMNEKIDCDTFSIYASILWQSKSIYNRWWILLILWFLLCRKYHMELFRDDIAFWISYVHVVVYTFLTFCIWMCSSLYILTSILTFYW